MSTQTKDTQEKKIDLGRMYIDKNGRQHRIESNSPDLSEAEFIPRAFPKRQRRKKNK